MRGSSISTGWERMTGYGDRGWGQDEWMGGVVCVGE